MKKSSHVTLGLLAAVAVFATGCNRRTEVRDCVDQNKRIVDQRLCQEQDDQRRRGYTGGVAPYYWMYGGSSGGRIGDSVVGGRTSPSSGFSSVSRGGFGSSFGSSSS